MSSETPKVFVVGARRRGRPRVTAGASSIVSVRLWSEHHDALVKQASERRVPVADHIRSILATAATEFRTQK